MGNDELNHAAQGPRRARTLPRRGHAPTQHRTARYPITSGTRLSASLPHICFVFDNSPSPCLHPAGTNSQSHLQKSPHSGRVRLRLPRITRHQRQTPFLPREKGHCAAECVHQPKATSSCPRPPPQWRPQPRDMHPTAAKCASPAPPSPFSFPCLPHGFQHAQQTQATTHTMQHGQPPPKRLSPPRLHHPPFHPAQPSCSTIAQTVTSAHRFARMSRCPTARAHRHRRVQY